MSWKELKKRSKVIGRDVGNVAKIKKRAKKFSGKRYVRAVGMGEFVPTKPKPKKKKRKIRKYKVIKIPIKKRRTKKR